MDLLQDFFLLAGMVVFVLAVLVEELVVFVLTLSVVFSAGGLCTGPVCGVSAGGLFADPGDGDLCTGPVCGVSGGSLCTKPGAGGLCTGPVCGVSGGGLCSDSGAGPGVCAGRRDGSLCCTSIILPKISCPNTDFMEDSRI